MLTRAEKEEQVAELKEKFGRAQSVYLVDYRGIDVQSINQLRSQIHAKGEGDYEYRVIKNSVLRRATADGAAAEISEHLEGPTAVAISYGDPVGLAKVLVDFANAHEVFELKAGMVEGRSVGLEEIGTLARLPSLDELRGTLVGLIQAPATKLVRLFVEPAGQIARVVSAKGKDMDKETGTNG